MQRIRTLMLVVGTALIGWSGWGAAAQAPTPDRVVIHFDEAGGFLDDCSTAIQAVAADRVYAVQAGGRLDRAPLIDETGEASGTAPECWLFSGASLDLYLNQPATALAFNRSGTVRVQLYRGAALIYETTSSGLGGRFDYGHAGGFNRVLLTEAGDGGSSYVVLDDLQIDLPVATTSYLTRFEAMGVDSCGEQIAIPGVVTAAGGMVQAGQCVIAAGEAVTITSAIPLQSWDAIFTGTATLTVSAADTSSDVESDAETVADIRATTATFIQTRYDGPVGQITIRAGAEAATLDNLRLTWALPEPVIYSGIGGSPIDITLTNGNETTLSHSDTLWALSAVVDGDLLIQAYRDGQLVDVWRGHGAASARLATFWGGFDTLVLSEATRSGTTTLTDVRLYPLP